MQGFRDIFRTPWALCLTVTVVSLVTFLAGMFLMFVDTLEYQIIQRQAEVRFQVYWNRDTAPELVHKAWQGMNALPRFMDLRTFTPDAALDVLAQAFNEKVELKEFRKNNPLPATALLTFTLPREGQTRWAKKMLLRLRSFPGVYKVHYNPLRIDVLHSWVQLSKKVIWPVICFLFLVIGLVVGNTIKLALFQRRDEIEILRLVGASRMYIRIPLIIGGAAQGFLGGLIALGLLWLVHEGLQNMLNFPPLWIHIPFLSFQEAMGIGGGLIIVGIVSSFVAIREG